MLFPAFEHQVCTCKPACPEWLRTRDARNARLLHEGNPRTSPADLEEQIAWEVVRFAKADDDRLAHADRIARRDYWRHLEATWAAAAPRRASEANELLASAA